MQRFQEIPPWAIMWLIALAVYAAGKGVTLAAGARHAPAVRQIAYLLLFPGMDAGAFCGPAGSGMPWAGQTFRYAGNALAGAALLWIAARHAASAFLSGWIGMIGLVLLLHFGLLQLASLAWRAAGFDAEPLMREPIRAASVTEFWSVRWNTAFRALAHRYVFMPVARRAGARPAMLATFACSGLVHDLVISVPAGAGFGLPTAYFLLQGAGCWFERSRAGRRWLRRRWASRCFTIAVVLLPVPLLFHPAFVMRVFVPFMGVIGALPREGMS